MSENPQENSQKTRPLLLEIFLEMAVLGAIEFVLITLVLSFLIGRQRFGEHQLRAEQVAHAVGAAVASGGKTEREYARLAAGLTTQTPGYGGKGLRVVVYHPGRGLQLLAGFKSEEEVNDRMRQLLKEAHLARQTLRPGSLEPRPVFGFDEPPWVWAAVPMGLNPNTPPQGAVLVGVPTTPLWDSIAGQWLLAAYVAILLVTLLWLGADRVRKLVIEPLKELVAASRSVTEGERHYELTEPKTSEMLELEGHFEEMTTQLFEREQQLEARLAQLELAQNELIQSEKLATVGKLASGVAHEVGNPLSAVSGYLELLEDPTLDPETRKDLAARAAREIERAGDIVRGLLDLSKPRDFKPVDLELQALIEGIVSLVKGRKIFHNISIEHDSSRPVRVLADPGLIEQVLVNLFLNAADAMGGEGQIRVEVARERVPEEVLLIPGEGSSLRRGEEAVRIAVSDSGPGIAAEAAAHLFEPFFTTKEPGRGTGLGLSVSSQMLIRHGGILRLASAGGPGAGGATFEIWLPANEGAESST
ncbi:MAG: HAMP domain-containing protein [Chrysiogenetes bacterium]|nr:HAMP domain-containing protein [Chrysiogenetes bacterium]